MTLPSSHEVTQLLKAWSAGDEQALERLTPLCVSSCTGSRNATWLINAPTIPCKPRRWSTKSTYG